MSEENETPQEGWSGVKKAIIGAITTAVTAGGAWFVSHLPGGEEPKEEVKTEQTSPSAAPVVINVQQNQENKQQTKTDGGSPQVIRERVIEKQAPAAEPAPKKPAKDEEDPW